MVSWGDISDDYVCSRLTNIEPNILYEVIFKHLKHWIPYPFVLDYAVCVDGKYSYYLDENSLWLDSNVRHLFDSYGIDYNYIRNILVGYIKHYSDNIIDVQYLVITSVERGMNTYGWKIKHI
jgi:hypothetical protein